jgi:hypothetical protein
MSTLEDIQYLKEHGNKESYLFLVDSSQRDKLVWRSPSEYEIVFDSPFRHVYGLDVISAYIPRTQYIIDDHNNSLVVTVGGQTYTVRVPTGDYSINPLVVELSKLLPGGLTVETVSKPPELKNKMRFFGRTAFSFNMSKSTIREVLGFSEPLNQHEPLLFASPPGYIPGKTEEVFMSRQRLDADIVKNTLFSPVPDLNKGVLITATQWVRQRFVAQTTGKLFRLSVNFGVLGAAPADSSVYYEIVDSHGSVIVYGNIQVILNQFLQASVVSREDFMEHEPLVEGQTYFIVLKDPDNTSGTDGFTVLYNRPEIPLAEAISQSDIGVYTGVWTSPLPPSDDLCVSLDLFSHPHVLEPPGVFNLTGDRFIQIRCREIEQHLYRTRAYEKYTVGLAKIQMGVFGYGQDRFDYSSFPPREFHPIGRLSSLTLRFERLDGSLYDFKGVDHNITMVLRYYAVKDEGFNQNILNPTYTPNYLSWTNTDMQKYDSEEEDA